MDGFFNFPMKGFDQNKFLLKATYCKKNEWNKNQLYLQMKP
jgi:hypothetical protein